MQADQRVQKYGTLKQTTHVNSVAELPDGRVLATLFHQGTVIAIDRATGSWQTLLGGLDHPHAVRVLDEEHITVADTAHGKALLISLKGGQARVEVEVDGLEETCCDLLANLVKAGHRIAEFRQRRADLEEIFMNVTKGEVQ